MLYWIKDLGNIKSLKYNFKILYFLAFMIWYFLVFPCITVGTCLDMSLLGSSLKSLPICHIFLGFNPKIFSFLILKYLIRLTFFNHITLINIYILRDPNVSLEFQTTVLHTFSHGCFTRTSKLTWPGQLLHYKYPSSIFHVLVDDIDPVAQLRWLRVSF